MLEPDVVSDLLDAFVDNHTARTRGREIQTLRGVRGVPTGEVARVAAAVWEEQQPTMQDEVALTRLFGTAWEDGLIAIGILAALLPDHPAEALDVGREWADRVDDHQTADALGSLVLGPGILATGQDPVKALGGLLGHHRPAVRRAALLSGLAMVPEEVKGPSVAPLRARMGVEGILFVAEPQTEAVRAVVEAGLRDPDPSVRKGLRRVLAAWSLHDPEAAMDWLGSVKGGVPKILREAAEKAARKGRRLAKERRKAAAAAEEAEDPA